MNWATTDICSVLGWSIQQSYAVSPFLLVSFSPCLSGAGQTLMGASLVAQLPGLTTTSQRSPAPPRSSKQAGHELQCKAVVFYMVLTFG